ncbi:MAG: cytochrome c biogenesis protein CcsA [Tepidisphaeraceae bacterium]|jgi:heme exporter protein C
MSSVQGRLIRSYWIAVALLFAADLVLIIRYTPDEQTMGAVQKIFYLHLPVAINTFLACLTAFVASIAYLWHREGWWDDLAAAAARVSVQLCAVVLATGMIWGRAAWGVWWTWSPRLTFSLILFLLYVVYLVIRSSVEGRERRAIIGSVYAIIAFLDVPLVWLSARLLPDIHPGSVQLEPAMKMTLLASFVPVTLLAVGLVVTRFVLNRTASVTANSVQASKPRDIRTAPLVTGAALHGPKAIRQANGAL